MRLSELDYELPEELIAQEPLARRDEARLLVLDRGGISARRIQLILRLILAVVFSMVLSFGFVASSSWAADTPCKNPCGKGTSWSEFNVFALKVTSPATPLVTTQYGMASLAEDSADIQIDAETAEGGATKTGKILMVGGRVLAIPREHRHSRL